MAVISTRFLLCGIEQTLLKQMHIVRDIYHSDRETRMNNFKRILTFILLMFMLSGCETIEGAGEDVENVGENIQDAAE